MITISVSALLLPLFALAGVFTAAAILLQRRIHRARWKLALAERHSLERRLHQSQKMESIGQLTSGIAHDFNNLIAIITANLDLLDAELASNPAVSERLASARKATSRAANLTRRLLTFASKEFLHPAAIDLEHSVRNALELAVHTLGRNIEITTDFTAALPPILIDPAALETALLNVFINARDAMPQGGTLHVATSLGAPGPQPGSSVQPGNFALITVTDTGHGMKPETLHRVFEPFFTTKERGRGTGLGLPMVYGFARQSKGHIKLASAVGQGTTVSLYLPLANSTVKPRPQLLSHREAVRTQATILLVDDEPELLDVTSLYLRKLGYKTLKASSPAEALRLSLHCSHIDAVVTDIVMPGKMNGVELARKLGEQRPQLRIIYTSGFNNDAPGNEHLPPDCMLHKPYRLTELAEMLQDALQQRRPVARASLANIPPLAMHAMPTSLLQ
jgi:signal transduction histidine kinase/CheY-like chemotaxis protein